MYRAFMNGIGPNCNLASDWADSAGIIVYGSYLYFVHKLATRELPPSCESMKLDELICF